MTETGGSLHRARGSRERGGGDGLASNLGTPHQAVAVREARLLARRLPDDIHCVAILRGPESRESERAAVVTLAKTLSESRTFTLLGNLGSEADPLDSYLGVEEPTGLSDVILGWEVVANIAVPSWIHGFIYLPAGDAALPARRLLAAPAFRRLAERVREAGSLLLLNMPEGLSADAFPPNLLDGLILIGDPDPIDLWSCGVPVLGVVRLPSESEASRPRPIARGSGRTVLVRGRLSPNRGGPEAASRAPPSNGGRSRQPLMLEPEDGGASPEGRIPRPGARKGTGEARGDFPNGRKPRTMFRSRRPNQRRRSRLLVAVVGILVTLGLALLLSWLIVRQDPLTLLS